MPKISDLFERQHLRWSDIGWGPVDPGWPAISFAAGTTAWSQLKKLEDGDVVLAVCAGAFAEEQHKRRITGISVPHHFPLPRATSLIPIFCGKRKPSTAWIAGPTASRAAQYTRYSIPRASIGSFPNPGSSLARGADISLIFPTWRACSTGSATSRSKNSLFSKARDTSHWQASPANQVIDKLVGRLRSRRISKASYTRR